MTTPYLDDLLLNIILIFRDFFYSFHNDFLLYVKAFTYINNKNAIELYGYDLQNEPFKLFFFNVSVLLNSVSVVVHPVLFMF